MRYYIISGEASGDLHGSNLIKALKQEDEQAEFRVWGGDRMEKAGGKVVMHYQDLAFMGFTEVLMNLRTILRNLAFCKKDLMEYQPDALILIDYPGFNLRIAKFAHEQGLKVYYYISPQVWAWKKNRVKKIRRYVDKMFVILPFEKDFYKEHDVDVEFVGHPLIDAIEAERDSIPSRETFLREKGLPDKPIIAILPGSRKQEISRMLPAMMSLKADYPAYQFLIAQAPSVPDVFYHQFIDKGDIGLIPDATYPLLEHATAALVTSGTATLETALFRTPEVVCYSGGKVSIWIAKRLVNISFISLVNLIMEREVVKELIQNDLHRATLKQELDRILPDGPARERMLDDLDELREKLGGVGASQNTARGIVQLLKE